MIPLNQPEFAQALPVVATIQQHGHEAYFVGGCIRDTLLGMPIHDIDIATSAYPAEVQSMFPKHFDVGLEHGTVMVWHEGQTYEVTTFRSESQYQDYRRPQKVEFVKSLKEDLKRRDFTMNALAMTSDGQIVDYFGGEQDISDSCIRAVGIASERFGEDALRMMRAVRFASQLNFYVEAETKAALCEMASLLEKIAVERVLVEMNKLWTGANWQTGIKLMLDTGLYLHCPQMQSAKEILVTMSLDLTKQVQLPNSNFAWALLMFFNHHAPMAATEPAVKFNAGKFARAWKMSNADAVAIQTYLSALEYRLVNEAWTSWELYQWGKEVCFLIEQFVAEQQQNHSNFGRKFSSASPDQVMQIWQDLPIYSLKDLAINGKSIISVFAPQDKRLIGQALKLCEEKVITGEVMNDKDALIALITDAFAW